MTTRCQTSTSQNALPLLSFAGKCRFACFSCVNGVRAKPTGTLHNNRVRVRNAQTPVVGGLLACRLARDASRLGIMIAAMRMVGRLLPVLAQRLAQCHARLPSGQTPHGQVLPLKGSAARCGRKTRCKFV